MRPSRRLLSLGFVLATGLAACARYEPEPITAEGTSASLEAPPPERLAADAAGLRHPRLPPVRIDPASPLTPEAAAVVAVLVHPQLRAARAQHGLAAAQVLQAGLLPDPQVSGSLDIPVTGDTSAATVGWSLGLSWEITSFISRGARQRGADATLDAVDLAIAWQEWQVAAAARQAVVRLAGARERLPLAIAAEDCAEAGLALHRRGAAIGAVTAEALLAYEAARDQARANRIDAESEVEKERLVAVRCLGFPVDHPLPVASPSDLPGSAFDLPRAVADAAAAHLEERRLDLIGLRAGYLAQEEAVHAAVLGQFPKISIGITRSRDTGALGLLSPGVAIDLPVFDGSRGAIAVAGADRRRLRAEYVQRVFEARHDLAEACAEAAASDRRWQESVDALQRSLARETALHDAAEARSVDAAAVPAARLERLRTAGETSLWHQRHLELRIAIELAAGCLLPPSDATHPPSTGEAEPAP